MDSWPPQALKKGVGATAFYAFLAWVAITLIELQTGQARLEERLGGIERRLDRAPVATR